ncbi:MAG TPA: hypothetical protein VJ912_00100, partial [Candidatus Nanoarchaeia archaeon]|nr:hypothetical protein [Candidatus Nanoarchaeia archaeon]
EDVYKDTRELLQGVSGVMQSLRQRGVQKLSEKEINNLEKEISNLEEALEEGEKVYSASWGIFKKGDSEKLKKLRKELEETRKQITSGIPTKSAQIRGAVIDIGADIFPPKAIADIADILGQVLPTDKQIKKATEKIKEKGWEGLKDVSSRAWKNVKDFFTNREQKEQLESTIKEINEEKQKAKDLIKEGKVENPAEVRDYINSLEEQEKNAKTLIDNLETNKFINIGIFGAAVIGTSAGLFRRLRGKKISTDATDYFTNKATAEEFVKKSNSQIDTVKVKDSPFVGMDIGFDEISYLNKNILKNKVDPKNVKDVQIRYSTDRLPGKAYVKKFREKISPGVKVDRYGVRYKPDSYINKIDVIMNLKDGTRNAFSVTSKAKIPFFRFKNLKNSLKYGTNKRVDFIKQAQAEDMLMGVRTRPRKVRGRDETRFTPEEYFLGRQIGKEKKKGAVKETISEVRRKPKVADKKRLSAEEYWKFGERVSVQKTRRVEKPVQRTYLGDFGVGPTFTRKVSFGKTKTINTDLGLDTSTLSYYLSRHIEQIKKLPKSKWDMNKLTRQDKANLINNIYNRNIKPADLSNPRYSSKLVLLDKAIDTAKAIDSGKGTVLLKNKNVKKLTDQDYLDIQSAISSQSIPKVKYESLKKQSSKIVDNTSKKVKNTRNKISNSLNKITKIRNQLGYGFVSPSKTKIDSSIKNLQEIRQELSKSLDELNKQSSEIKNVEKTINENIVGVTNESQLRDLQDTQSKISSLKTSITTQYQRITDITQNIRNIITEFRPDRIRTPRTPSLPKLPKSKKKIKKKRKQKDFIGYNTFMKPVGKKNWKKVNQFPMSYSNAQDLGAFKADNTLQASFRVRKGSAPARKPTEKFEKGYFLDNFDEFRNYKKKKGKKEFTPGQWIEKADRRLDSRSEVSSIQKARKKSSKKSKKNNKKKKKKKTKSAEDFWLS